MAVSPVTEYYKKHRQLILENLELSRLDENADIIHDMRVSFKRLKILLQFLEKISGGDFIAREECKHFNKFYKKSGRLRDLHVHINLISFYKDKTKEAYLGYLEYIQKHINKQNHRYQKALNCFNTDFFDTLGLKCDSIVKDKSDQDLIIIATGILTSKLAEIKLAYQQALHDKSFHRIRRYLKELQYLNNIIKDRLPLKAELNIDSCRLAEIGQLLGAWHDKLNAEKILSNYISKARLQPEQQASYLKLLAMIQKDKATEYQHLDTILADELNLK